MCQLAADGRIILLKSIYDSIFDSVALSAE
jgi:hypothetical protein